MVGFDPRLSLIGVVDDQASVVFDPAQHHWRYGFWRKENQVLANPVFGHPYRARPRATEPIGSIAFIVVLHPRRDATRTIDRGANLMFFQLDGQIEHHADGAEFRG